MQNGKHQDHGNKILKNEKNRDKDQFVFFVLVYNRP